MKTVIVCVNARSNPNQPSCAMRGSLKLLARLTAEIEKRQLPIRVDSFHCLGLCTHGPNAKLAPDGPTLQHLSVDRLPALIAEIEAFIAK
ncbi:MAG TPA: (2Fe-2S) ferredoxin domain-containing protein [Methylophilaceae bacterium]|nr:(2Fe-2S) ferredoxin domain-containing protein [Methylophilaceae bacterium]